MRAVEVGQSARGIQGRFVVERSIQRRVAARGRVGRARERVRALEVAPSPAARQRRLQRMVMRIGVIGKELEAAVSVDTLHPRTRGAVGKRVCRDGELLSPRARLDNRIGWTGAKCLQDRKSTRLNSSHGYISY